MAYNTIKHFTTKEDFNEVTGRVSFDIDTGTDFGVIKGSIEWYPEDRVREGEGNYGPWRLLGNIDLKADGLDIKDKGLFQNTDYNDKTKFEDGATFKIENGKFLKIYPSQKVPNTYAIYYKSKIVEEPTTQDLPF